MRGSFICCLRAGSLRGGGRPNFQEPRLSRNLELVELLRQIGARHGRSPGEVRTWNEIAYFHIADNPGRLEPTTGEINYSNILRHIHAKGYIGILDMEHYNSKPGKEGERTVIDTYVALDNF